MSTKKSIQKQFPIIPERRSSVTREPHPLSVPWSVAELAYSVYAGRYGTGQSLQRLAERGGFHVGEMDDMLPDWRERVSELTAAQQRIEELTVESERYITLSDKLQQRIAELEKKDLLIRTQLLGLYCLRQPEPGSEWYTVRFTKRQADDIEAALADGGK